MTGKLLGAAIFMLSSALAGSAICRKRHKRACELQGICALIEYIKNNIDCFLTPLPVIFKNFECPALDSCGFTERLRSDGIKAAALTSDISLGEDEKKLLAEFGDTLGREYRGMETKKCEYYLSAFGRLSAEEEEKSEKSDKLYRGLPPLLALCLLIILV